MRPHALTRLLIRRNKLVAALFASMALVLAIMAAGSGR